jgi:hypothetical protein
MGDHGDLWVLLLVDVHFIRVRGSSVQAAQIEGALWKLAALSGAGMLALALATPARADDQAPPPPLMLAKTAVIAADEPDATVPVETAAPATDSAPAPAADPAPVRVVATPGWKLAAKPHVVRHAAPVRVQSPTPQRVISTRPRPVHAVQPHHAAKRARSAAAPTHTGWYQLTPAQYRGVRADSRSSRPAHAARATPTAAVGVALPSPAQPQRARTICELRLRKCLQFCSWIATDNASGNGRWIGACISSPDPASRLDRLHELLLQRLWTVALEDGRTASERQYQHLGTQYQTGAASFGWELVAARSNSAARVRPARPVATPVPAAPVAPRGHARVLAAAATHRPRPAAKTVERSSPEARGAGPAAAQPRAATDGSFPSTVALIGMALLALALAAGSVLPGMGTVRTRLGSRGLTSSSIDLGRESPRGRGISYRD